MGAGSLEARVSALEQIIIIIISSGGWRPGGPYGGDPFNTDTTRLEALYRHIP